jgi:hypothetical protein
MQNKIDLNVLSLFEKYIKVHKPRDAVRRTLLFPFLYAPLVTCIIRHTGWSGQAKSDLKIHPPECIMSARSNAPRRRRCCMSCGVIIFVYLFFVFVSLARRAQQADFQRCETEATRCQPIWCD